MAGENGRGGGDPIRQPRKIRYTDAEWDTIVDRARACGRTPARYVRETSLGIVPKVRHRQANGELIYELGQIGTTLSRIAAIQGDAPDRSPSLEPTLSRLLATIQRLDGRGR